MNKYSSFWISTPFPSIPTSTIPSSCEICIIGGGFSGIATAYWLCKFASTPLRIVILEQRNICEGATGRNGGHMWSSPRSFYENSKTLGLDIAKQLFEFSNFSCDLVKQLVQEDLPQENKVELRSSVGSIHVATSEEEWKDLQNTFAFFQDLQLEDQYIELWSREKAIEELGTDKFVGGALFSKNASQLWPSQLVFELTHLLMKKYGDFVTIVPYCKVNQVIEIQNTIQVEATHLEQRTISISCNKVVYATNAWTNQLIASMKEIIVPVRGQVLITEPYHEFKWKGGFSANYGYEYMITRPNGQLILGGCRWTSPSKEWNCVDDSTIHTTVAEELRSFLKTNFPNVFRDGVKVQQEWTGIMGFSKDGLPIVGELKEKKNHYILAGFTGNGMPNVFACARAVAKLILNLPFEDFKEFSSHLLPSRLQL